MCNVNALSVLVLLKVICKVNFFFKIRSKVNVKVTESILLIQTERSRYMEYTPVTRTVFLFWLKS